MIANEDPPAPAGRWAASACRSSRNCRKSFRQLWLPPMGFHLCPRPRWRIPRRSAKMQRDASLLPAEYGRRECVCIQKASAPRAWSTLRDAPLRAAPQGEAVLTPWLRAGTPPTSSWGASKASISKD